MATQLCGRGFCLENKIVRRTLAKLAFLLLLAATAVLPASAQAVYGSIFGTVTDNTGAVIPNATITVTDISKNTSVTAVTNGSGQYRVEHLIPDTYRVTAAASGFSQGSAPDVVVFADTAPKVDLRLQVGAVSNTVTVTAGAPLLTTDRADVSTILNARAITTLPNLQRNFTSFELLTPGTSYIGWSVGQDTNPQQSQQIEVNGQLPFATGYELDGTDNQDPIQGVAVINPNLEAVSEMKVTSQNYDAEFGGAVAGMVTAQTKSGSNSFHGSLFEYRRSDAQQARNPFNQIGPDSIPSFVHNQFGGSIGGPILRDKLFFFGDYQGLREKTGTTITTTVPTATAHNSCTSGGDCNLSDYLNPALGGGTQYQAYDPQSNTSGTAGRAAFAGNIIPAGRLSAPAVALISEMPLPNFGNGSIFDNYAGSGSGGFDTDQFDVRIDAQMSQKFHGFGRYTRFNSDLTGMPVFGAAGGPGFGLNNFAGTDNAVDQNVAAGGDYALSNNWLTDFRFGWFRININDVGPDFNQPLGTQLGIGGVNQGDLAITGGLPQFNISVPANGSNGSSVVSYGTTTNLYEQTESQYQFVNNWSHLMGNHNIRFGADIRYALNHLVGVNNDNLPSGQFQFPGTITAGPSSQGLGYATFVLGNVGTFNRTAIQNTNAAERQRRWFFYAQDQWRATQKLTVNYGVRWDLFFPETVAGKGQGGLLDLQSGNVRIAGYGPYNNSMNVNMEYSHVSPRIGLAWQVMPKTVVRAGYGRAYGMGWSGDIFGEVLTFSYPTAVTQNFNPSSNFSPIGFDLATGPPAYVFPPIPSDGNYPLPDTIQLPTRPLTMRIPTIDAWNFTIQQELSRSMALQIGYVGSHGIHNMFDSSNQADVNQPTIAGFDCVASGAPVGCNEPINPDTGLPYTKNERQPYFDGTAQKLGVPFGVPHGWTQSFRYNANQATTKYNALQVIFQKRFSQGFQILSHYTWSQARANESDYFFINSKADFGNSYYNRRNVFVFTGNWDLPFGKGKAVAANAPGFVNQLIGGFSLNGTWTWEGGLPFTPSYSLCTQDQDIDGQGGSMCRPNAVGSGAAAATLHAGSFDPVAHQVQYFTPVPTLAFAGDVEGPYERPSPGTFGDMQRNSLWGPGLINVDAAVSKKFFLTERLNFQLEAQAFNAFNHPNLGQPNGCVDCGSSSGIITGIVASQDGTTMRRLQFSARFEF